MDFSTAFAQIRNGSTMGMRLPGWNVDVIINVQLPDEHSKNTEPYLYLESGGKRVPWNMTNPELFAKDWYVVDAKGVIHDAVNLAGAEITGVEQVMAGGKYPNVTRIMAKKDGIIYVLENGRVYKEVKE